ncbi:MAG: DUF2066 domain-containing protein [Rhodospirillales bacterium]|nr:MAG: DUF2066 domain-containing protein [Rhodospirillales bacterium]
MTETLQRRRPRAMPVSLALSLLVSLLALVLAATAAAETIAVTDIAVDVQAETAAAARDAAIVQAHRQAFRQVVAELSPGTAVPEVSDDRIASLVRDFSIVQERSSAVRYLGTFEFRFDAAAVRRLLGQHDLPVAAPADPVVVVPVYRAGDVMTLWDEPNPWRRAWAAAQTDGALVPTMVPLGDLADVTTIAPEEALAGDLTRLTTLAGRYGAAASLVVTATTDADPPAEGETVTVSATRFGARGADFRTERTLRRDTGESAEALFGRAVAAVKEDLKSWWSAGDRLVASGPASVLAVRIPVEQLRDWVNVRRRLSAAAAIQDLDVVVLTRQEVRVNLRYVGDIDQLVASLRQADLDLADDPDGAGWTLRSAWSDAAPR